MRRYFNSKFTIDNKHKNVSENIGTWVGEISPRSREYLAADASGHTCQSADIAMIISRIPSVVCK